MHKKDLDLLNGFRVLGLTDTQIEKVLEQEYKKILKYGARQEVPEIRALAEAHGLFITNTDVCYVDEPSLNMTWLEFDPNNQKFFLVNPMTNKESVLFAVQEGKIFLYLGKHQKTRRKLQELKAMPFFRPLLHEEYVGNIDLGEVYMRSLDITKDKEFILKLWQKGKSFYKEGKLTPFCIEEETLSEGSYMFVDRNKVLFLYLKNEKAALELQNSYGDWWDEQEKIKTETSKKLVTV